MNKTHPLNNYYQKSDLFIGIDVGSVSLDTVVMNSDGVILEEHYIRTNGEPLKKTYILLQEILKKYPAEKIKGLSTTGTGGKLLAKLLGGAFTNEIISQAKAIEFLHPEIRTIIEMGGEDAKLILLNEDKTTRTLKIEDISLNSVCAAGTGSFLDQQATRLGFTIEEFGKAALKSKSPPRVAGRCSVFAKSDMIHLQQIATPDYDIVAGLCFAVARNFKSSIGKGKKFLKPVSFQGGVAANLGVRRAFREVLQLEEKDFIVPKYFASTGAIGSVLLSMEKETCQFASLDGLKKHLNTEREKVKGLAPLIKPKNHPSYNKNGHTRITKDKIKTYLGIDVGSVSTNLVLIDEKRNLITKRYLMTAGRPIEAVKKGLAEIGEEVLDTVDVIGVGVTGSGRYLIGDFVGADVVRNEITAQATGAIHIDPQVDTIFEIGGQDSKYISIDNGIVVDFEMNKVCAAGTGSFLEEQAERLGISIKGEFSELALSSKNPASMGEKCTVFIESDLVHHQQSGASKDELVAGLSYSIVYNYLNRVVGERRIGSHIFFQGGTAANLSVVAAFEKVLGKPVFVPEHHEVTGAIGSAILSMVEKKPDIPSNFKGFDLSKKRYKIKSFECKDCSNLCEVREVKVEGESPLYYGSRCEKYDVKGSKKTDTHIPDLFAERVHLLQTVYKEKPLPDDAPVIGIPRILYMYELLPFWKAFFNDLGYKVVLSHPTNKKTIRAGVEKVVTETCFPIKVSHGHIENLVERGIKTIFIPSIIDLPPAKPGHNYTYHCPYVQAMPYLAESTHDFSVSNIKVIAPPISFRERNQTVKNFAELGRLLGKRKKKSIDALDKALDIYFDFKKQLVSRGKEVLDNLKKGEKAIIIVGRPYNTCDSEISLSLPKKLKALNMLSIPFDMLPVEENIDTTIVRDMYWKAGQRIIAIARLIKEDERLFPIYITNFGCGPDSFITHHFKAILKGKPVLQLEIDEHSADAGIITRCEAFFDSLKNAKPVEDKELPKPKRDVLKSKLKRKIHIPYMTDHVFSLAAAFKACGMDAEVMPMSDEESLNYGRKYTYGKECYPCTLTTGDMLKIVRSDGFEPDKTAFFMPSANGPCRFGQYNRFHRLLLDELGHKDIPIYAPDQDQAFYSELGMLDGNFPKFAWWGIIATDLLDKRLRATRPYEINSGDSEELYWKCIKKVCKEIESGKIPEDTIKEAKKAFQNIKVEKKQKRPLIGLVGEIYVRSNTFSNDNLVKKLEGLGAEVLLPPIAEWIYYTNKTTMKRTWERKDFTNWFKTALKDYFQKRYEHRLENVFDGDLPLGHEPDVKDIINAGASYLHPSFEGEAILSVGKAVDFVNKGVCGIVNAMPFGCMPGTVVNAILRKLREKTGNIPYLNMVYEGLENTNSRTRLEAFIHQAKTFDDAKKNKKTYSRAI